MPGEKETTHEELIEKLIWAESRGDHNAIGDKHLKLKAYGILQCRQPAVDDVNRRFGTSYKAEECLGDIELSKWLFRRYMEIYATEKRLGREVTDEDRARIWNGGPNGHKSSRTVAYWRSILKQFA